MFGALRAVGRGTSSVGVNSGCDASALGVALATAPPLPLRATILGAKTLLRDVPVFLFFCGLRWNWGNGVGRTGELLVLDERPGWA